MKSGRTLVELATEVQRRAGAKHDYVAKAEAISMETEIQNDFEKLVKGEAQPVQDFHKLLQLNVGGNRFKVNEITHDQIGQYLSIPAAYYDRMRQDQPELLATNINTWLASQVGQKRMVRTLDGNARAFLSDKYRPIENEDLCEAILPILLDGGRFDIVSCEVTDRKLYIKVVDRSVSRKLAETGNHMGDGQHKIVRIAAPAITVSNSEVGQGALSVQVGLYDSFCSNLSFFSARSMKKYHVGARHDIVGDDLVALLSAQTQNLTNAALMSQVQDVVKNAFDPARFNELCDQVDGTTQEKIDQVDVVKMVNLTGKQVGLTEGENKGVLNALIAGGDLTRFGLYNAVTRFAADVESYDRASELERAGAAVVELPQGDWKRLLAQAAA
jgi:hypothetical protein